MCVPVLSGYLVEPDTGDGPVLLAVNLTPELDRRWRRPRRMTPDGATSGQMVHGHLPAESNALLVVNVYVYGASIVWPNLSLAPLMVAV